MTIQCDAFNSGFLLQPNSVAEGSRHRRSKAQRMMEQIGIHTSRLIRTFAHTEASGGNFLQARQTTTEWTKVTMMGGGHEGM